MYIKSCVYIFLISYTHVYIPRTTGTAKIICVCSKKNNFWRGQPSNGVFLMRRKLWILNGSSKLWCFEWNGVLSIPQVWRRLSPHEERITHVSTLKTSYQKNYKLKRHRFPAKRHISFGCFQCMFGFWHATYLPMLPKVCEYHNSEKMQEWQLTRQESRQTVETDVFRWDTRNYLSDDKFL